MQFKNELCKLFGWLFLRFNYDGITWFAFKHSLDLDQRFSFCLWNEKHKHSGQEAPRGIKPKCLSNSKAFA